jgi:hypothetical protein
MSGMKVAEMPPGVMQEPGAGVVASRGGRSRRLYWLYELALVAFGYWLYSLVRNSVTAKESLAVARAEKLVNLERSLHVYHERAVNLFVAAHGWLAYICNYYYSIMHFAVTITVGVWVVWKHTRHARGLRIAWYSMNCFALIGFAFFPLAPPRLLPGGGYRDTVVEFHTWGSWGDSGVASHSNQYAAMPSMHIGWSLWVAIVLVRLGKRPWVRVLGALYPLVTLFVIVGTANHYVLDAVGGVVALGGGWVVARVIRGRPVFEAGDDAERAGPSPRELQDERTSRKIAHAAEATIVIAGTSGTAAGTAATARKSGATDPPVEAKPALATERAAGRRAGPDPDSSADAAG